MQGQTSLNISLKLNVSLKLLQWKWGGRPRPRRTPWSGCFVATKPEADEGVGRGPGGPPHFGANTLATILLAAALLPAAIAHDIADAVMNQDSSAVPALLALQNHDRQGVAANPDVNAAQADGTTALHWAARWDDLETAQLLIRAGAAAGAANHDGATPMFLAAQNGSAAMIELLLKAGADVNAPVLAHMVRPR